VTLACLFGVSYAFLQFGLYGAAGPSASLTNSLNVGLGVSGLALNSLRMLLLATIPDNLNKSTEVFFFISVGFLLVCTILAVRFSVEIDKEPKVDVRSDTSVEESRL